jgi:transcriptional regulator with XRE-family HTH domain
MLSVNYQWKDDRSMARPSPTVRRRRLRYELRRLRTEQGLTIEDVQERSNGDVRAPSLSRWETGERSIRPSDLRVLLDIYDVPPADREALLTLARQAKERGWWQAYTAVMPESFQAYVGLEAEASLIREYAAELVPGLLQTEDYYREFLSTAPADTDTARKIEVRTTRQQRLTGDDRPQYWAVLNEAVIRRTVGGPEIMRTQLARILELAALQGVTIQVLPFTAGAHPAMEGPFSILGFPEPVDPDIVYLENQAGSVYLENADEIDRYSQVITHLIARALSPEDSARLIRNVAASL